MKSCLKVPRVYLPREENGNWTASKADAMDPVRREASERNAAGPSALRFLLAAEEGRDALREEMYAALEGETIEKLNRGFVFVERDVEGGTRYGILAAVDLEQCSFENGESAPVRPATAYDREEAKRLAALRKGTPLEFPTAIALYRDKKQKIVRAIRGCDFELLYDFEIPEGRLKGRFIPRETAVEIAEDMQAKGDPVFALIGSVEEVAAAKAHWEELKPTLAEKERAMHPARFTLVEFVNLYDPALVLRPAHRLLKDVETEAFCDYFSRNIKCKRVGNVLYPALSGADGVARVNTVIESFLRQSGGQAEVVCDEKELLSLAKEEDAAAVVMKEIEKEDFFGDLKGGKTYPMGSFALSPREERYCTEGREISYD